MLPELKGSTQPGMTLQQYISNLEFIPSPSQNQQPFKQQNFLQNTLLAHSRPLPSATFKDLIEEVDEESHDDSRNSGRFNFPKEKNTDQRTKETFREELLAESIPFEKQVKEQVLRNTAYFQGPQSFRIKHHVSCSPNKKHSEKVINPSLTLFGHKFKTSKGQPIPIQELVTFYGKSPQGEKSGRESKCYSKPSGHLQLDELIEAEKKIKTNFSQKVFLKELRVEGLKDRFAQRKNKFC